MERLAIISGRGVSLDVVCHDIKRVAQLNNIEAQIIKLLAPITYIGRNFDRAVIFAPFDPHYVLSYISYYHSLRKMRFPAKFYTTVEGVPEKRLLPDWVARSVKPIANSYFTASCLRAVGIEVSEVIPHGIDWEQATSIRRQMNHVKKQRKDYVVFGTIGFNHPRKGFHYLHDIVQKCISRVPKARFMIISSPDVTQSFKQYQNVIATHHFGTLSRHEILQSIAGLDFYLCTSLAEGFGLPILEAQSLGTPCIHADYDPLNEISHKSNLRVKVTHVLREKFNEAVYNEMHYYNTDDMVDQIAYACDLRLNKPEAYYDLTSKVIKHASKYDSRYMYKPLVM